MKSKNDKPEIEAYWRSYLDFLGPTELNPPDEYQAWSFGNTSEMADELGDLVLQGRKTATTTLVYTFEQGIEPYPKIGDYHVILDGGGHPICIIQTAELAIKPFDEVDEDYASLEGEGDGSLDYWREAHWAFFSEECKKLNREPDMKMPVLCEQFKLVYPLI